MKIFLFRKKLTSQKDWYAQVGMSWHLAAFERCLKNSKNIKEIDTDVYISFLEDDSIQDASAVVGMVLQNLALYKQAHPEVEQVYIKSDNAA